ncbi:MAG: tetratricopeptide repeat protein [Bacteroidetes bacterium]|nr:tetratricopeptide repeat protein [Bacteroidota bacterium]
MEKLPRKELIFDMLVKEPNDVFLNYALAMEHLSAEEFKEAEAQLRKVLDIKIDYLPCYYQLGQVNEKLNNNDLALSYYKQGVELAKSQNNTKALGELNEAIWMLED